MIGRVLSGRVLLGIRQVALASGLPVPHVTRYVRQGGAGRSARGGAPSTARSRAVERIAWVQRPEFVTEVGR